MEPPNLESFNSMTWKWVKFNQLGKINIKIKTISLNYEIVHVMVKFFSIIQSKLQNWIYKKKDFHWTILLVIEQDKTI